MTVQVIDRGWERITRELRLIDGSFVKVGFPGEKEKKHKGSGLDMAHLAAIHEHGNDEVNIPPRPFMAQSFDKHRTEVDQQKDRGLSDIYEGKKTTEGALETLGVFFKGKVQETIGSGEFEPNKPATIARKGSSVPLIDQGTLRQSVDHEVVMK